MTSKHFTIDGRDLLVHYEDLPGVAEILNEVVLEDCYRFKWLRDSGVVLNRVIDVGAHMGIACAMMRHYWPEVEILAVEPQVEYRECIAENGANNIFIEAIQYCVTRSFYVSPISGGSLVYDPTVNFSEDIPRDYKSRHVAFSTLENVVERAGWKDGSIDLLKCDAEGTEINLLCNMTAPLRNRIRMALGEYHHIAGFRYIEQIIKLRYPHWIAECWGDPNSSMSMFAALPKV